MSRYRDVFGDGKSIIGVIHLPALPGYPQSPGLDAVLARTRHDVDALERGYAEGGYPRAMSRAAEKLAAKSERVHIPAIRVARLYAHAGEKDQALQWLEKAYEHRESNLQHLSVAWDWIGLKDDPRYQDLLRRMGLPS